MSAIMTLAPRETASRALATHHAWASGPDHFGPEATFSYAPGEHTIQRITMKRTRAASIAVVAIAGLALSGCSDDTTAVSSASKQEIADGVAAAKAFAAE